MGSVIQFYLTTALMMAPLMACALVGAVWAKRDLPYSGPFLTILVTSVTTPALVFHTLVTTELDTRALADIFGASVLALLICGGLCAVALKLWGKPVKTLLPTAWFPNAGNIGLPISQLAFGDEGLPVAVAFFAVSSFFQHTAGVRLLSGGSNMAALRNPVLIACVLAVLVRVVGVPVPQPVLESAQLLGTLTVPLMLLSLGHALALIPSSGLKVGSGLAGLRLVAGVLAGMLTVWLLDMSPTVGGALALQMSMPCAVVSYMYARRFTDSGDTSAGAVLVSTAVFLLVAPLLLWLAGAGL
ncbi:membrane protein, putative [plant metagenome]|uniref:Membrane protein, putative n=1 Tax=plant metagenome TaxID=1297885 RepID=A0A484PKY8_9ZZZZ